MSVGVHQRVLYNRSSLCDLIDLQDGQSEISSCRVTGHDAYANVLATAKYKQAKCPG